MCKRRMVRLGIWSGPSTTSALSKVTGPGGKVCGLRSHHSDLFYIFAHDDVSPRFLCRSQKKSLWECRSLIQVAVTKGGSFDNSCKHSPSALLVLIICIHCSSSSLTGSTFEPAGDIADEESEVITADSDLQDSMQDDEWEDLADAKASCTACVCKQILVARCVTGHLRTG